MKTRILSLFILGLLLSCTAPSKVEKTTVDLESWNEGETKTSIINFVKDVTNPESVNFVEIKDRIAVFDNDGNLWSEQPLYFQFVFAMDLIREMAPEHPEWKDDELMNAVLQGDNKKVMSFGEHGLVKILMKSHTGINNSEFEKLASDWINSAEHPRYKKKYTELVYQPMLELLDYLRANDFKLFIVSGGGIEFMRVWAEEVYAIPKNQIIGSSVRYELSKNFSEIDRLPELWFNNDKEGKPVGINRHIGRRPIFCSGNSDGDLAMMKYTAAGGGNRFMLYVHHTDSIREYAYDRKSHIGKLDKGLDAANENGWTVIDMATDWKVIYPFEINN